MITNLTNAVKKNNKSQRKRGDLLETVNLYYFWDSNISVSLKNEKLLNKKVVLVEWTACTRDLKGKGG